MHELLGAWALAAMVRLEPHMLAREAEAVEIAEAIGAVSGSVRDAADLVAVWHLETGRTGDCTQRGDHGHSVSCFAVWVCPGEHCLPAIVDVEYAARLALERLRESERACRDLKPENAWSLYTTGRCQTNHEARTRWRTARWLERTIPIVDAAVTPAA